MENEIWRERFNCCADPGMSPSMHDLLYSSLQEMALCSLFGSTCTCGPLLLVVMIIGHNHQCDGNGPPELQVTLQRQSKIYC